MFEEYKVEKLEEAFKDSSYYVVCLNYEIKEGIKILKSFDEMKDDLCNFQKAYIFNDDRMFTIIKFSEDDFRMKETVLDKKDSAEKEIYLDEKEITKVVGLKNFTKIKVRIADNEEFQYTGFVTGGDGRGKR